MSDYLWDKTGEADPEVERLESLLGGFAHRPRPLELPAVETRARRAPVWRYAAAAAVLLAVVAGALVMFRLAQQRAAEPVAESTTQEPADPREFPSPATPTLPQELVPQGRQELLPQGKPAPRRSQGDELANRSRRTRKRAAPESVAHRAPAGGSPVAPELANAAERLRAKEQLMYALRLTGVKLEEVRRKVQGEGDAEGAPE